MEVTDRLNNTLEIQHIEADPEQRAQEVLKSFDKEYTNLISVVESKAQISHDANLFSTMIQNIKNDLIILDTCIKNSKTTKNKVRYCTLSVLYHMN